MRMAAHLGAFALLSALAIAVPVSIDTDVTLTGSNLTTAEVQVEFQVNEAEAKTRRSSSSRRTTGFAKKRKSAGWSPNKVPKWRQGSSKPAKKYKPGESPFDKSRKARLAKGKQPFTAPTANGRSSTSMRTVGGNTQGKPTAGAPRTTPTARPKLNTTQRTTLYRNQAKSLNSPNLRSDRLRTQRSHSRNLHRRGSYSEASYWRSRAQFERNLRWRDRNMYGWGYGFHPGYTYHAGWGRYGYGYTRSGLSIVDGMILASLFHRPHYGGESVMARPANLDTSEVMAVPQGTQLSPDGKILMIPTADGGFEQFPIPVGSTIQRASMGILIQTPEGYGVLIPADQDSYRADSGYQVPDYAQSEMSYPDAYGSNSGGNTWLYVFIFVVLVFGGGFMAWKLTRNG